MASSPQTELKATEAAADASLARTLAPEEIRPGDYVTLLHIVAEVPSYYWFTESWNLPPDQPVRIRFTAATDGVPLKVESLCLPFVLVKNASGDRTTLDVRKCQLARLDRQYAKRAWKAYRKTPSHKSEPRC
jgi:hypothetical protein